MKVNGYGAKLQEAVLVDSFPQKLEWDLQICYKKNPNQITVWTFKLIIILRLLPVILFDNAKARIHLVGENKSAQKLILLFIVWSPCSNWWGLKITVEQ